MDDFQPREWQQECLVRLRESFENGRDFLVVATPGGGKTKLALAFAASLVKTGEITHVHVVTPSDAIRQLWKREAKNFGLILVRRQNTNLRNRNLPLDVGGLVTTYQQVASDAEAHAMNVENADGKALLILDEPHHLADSLAWGQAAKFAFEDARFRLHLSGTPFRKDGDLIPWIKFDLSGVAVAAGRDGFTYSYRRAMDDDVCRPVAFKYRNLDLAYTLKGRDWSVNFDDDLDVTGQSARLRSALLSDSGLVEDLIASADRDITGIRSRGGRFADAAGILVAMNQAHAADCAQIIEKVTGETPSVVVSDNKTCDDDLEVFRSGTKSRWVVSVRMISEGVDIPRLMVAVYATNIVSPLFFRQFVGRVVRVRHRGAHEMATIYMPADQRLKELADEIETDVRQFHRDNSGSWPELSRSLQESAAKAPMVIRSATLTDSGIIIGGYHFTPVEIADAAKFRTLYPEASRDNYSNEQIALWLAVARDENDINAGYHGGRRVERVAA